MIASGPTPTDDLHDRRLTTLTNITAVRLEALPDDRLPKGGPGRDPYGHFRLTGIEVDITPGSSPVQSGSRRATANPRQTAPTFDTIKVDDSVYRIEPEVLLSRTAHAYARKGGAWTVDAMKDDIRLPRQAVLIAGEAVRASAAAAPRLTIRLKHLDGTLGQGLGRFRLSVTSSDDPATRHRDPRALAPRARRSPPRSAPTSSATISPTTSARRRRSSKTHARP